MNSFLSIVWRSNTFPGIIVDIWLLIHFLYFLWITPKRSYKTPLSHSVVEICFFPLRPKWIPPTEIWLRRFKWVCVISFAPPAWGMAERVFLWNKYEKGNLGFGVKSDSKTVLKIYCFVKRNVTPKYSMFTSFTTTRSDSTLICTYLTNPCQCWRRLYEQNDGAAVKQGKRGKDSESKLRFSNSGLTLGLIPAGLLLLGAVGTAACAWLCNF